MAASELGKSLIGLVVDAVDSVGRASKDLANKPREAGGALVRLTKWPAEFRLGMRDEIKFTRLLKRMYPNTGESSEIGVPRLDFLSDLERDLMLREGVDPKDISAYFEEWFITSGRLLDISRELLGKDSDLPEALADLQQRTNGATGIAELASADLTSSQESIKECMNRFDSIAAARKRRGAHGWATRRSISFPGALTDSRNFEVVAFDGATIDAIDLDRHNLVESQQMSLAASITSNCAELFYESADGTAQVIKVDTSGISATRKSDMEGQICAADWFRFVAILLHESLRLWATFSIKEVALVLTESIALRADMVRIEISKGVGATVTRCLSDDPRHKVATHVELFRSLVQLSRCIRTGSQTFVERQQSGQHAILGLTIEQARKALKMPDYTYEDRNRAEKKIKQDISQYLDERSGGQYVVSAVDSVEVREPAVETPFRTPGGLEAMSERLISAMREGVERTQLAYHRKAKKHEPCKISGSMWLDRIAKGKLLTSERARELTHKRRRQDVPQELQSCRETSFYFPMYGRTVVFPKIEDVVNVRYARLQIGTEGDLSSAVSVLVALILWGRGQQSEAVDAAIAADSEGTQQLVRFCSGNLGAQLGKLLRQRNEETLKISELISCVDKDLHGSMDKGWVIREALSVASALGATYTTHSARTAGYLKAVESVRSRNYNSFAVIEADMAVPVEGVEVRRVITSQQETEFLVQDDSIDEVYEIVLTTFGGVTVDDLSNALMPNHSKARPELVVHIEARSARERVVKGSLYGTAVRVGVQ